MKPNILYDTDGAAGTGDGSQHQGNTFTQDDVNNIVAKATKTLKADFAIMKTNIDAVTAERDQFVTKNKERDDLEKTELERAQAERDEFKTKFETSKSEVDKFENDNKERDKRELEKVEKFMEGLTDTQKSIVESVPLYGRLDAISEFKQIKPGGMDGAGKGSGSADSNENMRDRLRNAKGQRERDQIIQESVANI